MLEGACLFETGTVTVTRPVPTDFDRYGAPVMGLESERVGGVLFDPSASQDLGAERPEGSRATAMFHFPRGYAKSLKGCTVTREGRAWRVVGDPQPYEAANTPGAFCLAAKCEAVDG